MKFLGMYITAIPILIIIYNNMYGITKIVTNTGQPKILEQSCNIVYSKLTFQRMVVPVYNVFISVRFTSLQSVLRVIIMINR